jgi:hypothetical protein
LRRTVSSRRSKLGLTILVIAGVAAALGARASLAAFNHTPGVAAMQSQVVSTARCMTVSVTDSSGNGATGGYVSVTVKASGTSTVLAKTYGLATNGGIQVCYGGASLPASVDVTGFADTNGNGAQDSGEPTFSGTA